MFNLGRFILFYLLTVVVVAAQPTSPPREDSYGLYSHFDPAMAIVVMVLVCAFFIVGFLSIYLRQCAEANAIANAPVAAAAAASAGERSRPKGLDPAVIESFPVFVYSHVKDLKIGKGTLECAVCLSEFEDDDTLRLIPKCSHVFHPECIDAWLQYHVTCPVCRAKLTPDSDAKPAAPVESSSNGTELNSNVNEPPSTAPATQEQNEFVIQVNDFEPRPIGKITGKFPRSHSTGHSLIQHGENVERFTLRLPEEIRKQIVRSGRLKRTSSYDVVWGREGSSRKGGGGEGSSRGKSNNNERWAFMRTPPFVSRTSSVKCQRGGGGGEGSNSWRGLTSVKEKLSCLNVKVEQSEKQEPWRSQSPV